MNAALPFALAIVLAIAFGCQVRAQSRSMSTDETIARVAPTGNPCSPEGSGTRPVAADSNGPTVRLNYGTEPSEKNPVRSFMYFVPLISPVPVGLEIGADNRQQVGIISYERRTSDSCFSVDCEFEMSGEGFCKYTFEPAGMIALRREEMKRYKGETLTNLLDYILFEGNGFGHIRVQGTLDGATQTVTEVELEFNGKEHKSPVTIGLYQLKSKDGKYCYENRSHELVARVNTLAFKKGAKPRMALTVASISKDPDTNGPVGQIKAAIANLFIKPVKVDPLGNETLLRFGGALFQQERTFTFPKAENLKELTLLAADGKGK